MTARKLRYAIATSVIVHGIVATLVIVQRPVPRAPAQGAPPADVDFELKLIEPPAAPMVDSPSHSKPVARPATRVPRPGLSRRRNKKVAPVAEPPVVAEPTEPTPSPTADPRDRFESLSRPPDLTPPWAIPPPPRIAHRPSYNLGLSLNPAPNVRHHRPRRRGVEGHQERPSGLRVIIRPDGKIEFRDPPIVSNVERRWIGVTGNQDLEGGVARLFGVDLKASEKKQIAEATREGRLGLALAEHERVMRKALFDLEERLESLLRAPGHRPAERRALVFEMWDECIEGGDDERGRLAEAARATIAAFIRRAFPAGGPDAYSAAELAALNGRRHSTLRFDPYAGSGRDPSFWP